MANLANTLNFSRATAQVAFLRQLPSGRWQWVFRDHRGNYQGERTTYGSEVSARAAR